MAIVCKDNSFVLLNMYWRYMHIYLKSDIFLIFVLLNFIPGFLAVKFHDKNKGIAVDVGTKNSISCHSNPQSLLN